MEKMVRLLDVMRTTGIRWHLEVPDQRNETSFCSGTGVAKWIINGTDYAVDAKNLPEGMRISEDGKILDVASFNPASQTASTNPGHTKDGVLQ